MEKRTVQERLQALARNKRQNYIGEINRMQKEIERMQEELKTLNTTITKLEDKEFFEKVAPKDAVETLAILDLRKDYRIAMVAEGVKETLTKKIETENKKPDINVIPMEKEVNDLPTTKFENVDQLNNSLEGLIGGLKKVA